jgi:hypothetical protein
MRKPLCIDLYCGLGGWAEGFLSEGYRVIGFDIERHDYYGTGSYPGQLVLQDVLTLDGAQFRDATVIVASPPCQAYSYMAMPWSRAKREIRWQQWERDSPFGDFRLNDLFRACFRIQREASAAAGHHIPMVLENVKGAQRWVGRAAWHYGSYYLWGDVPALMPFTERAQKQNPDGTSHGQGSWFAIADSKNRGSQKNNGGSWFGVAHNTESGVGQNPVHQRIEEAGIKLQSPGHYLKPGSGPDWFDGGAAAHGSGTMGRKAASAQIAKIPFALARHIAAVYKPREPSAVCAPETSPDHPSLGTEIPPRQTL